MNIDDILAFIVSIYEFELLLRNTFSI